MKFTDIKGFPNYNAPASNLKVYDRLAMFKAIAVSKLSSAKKRKVGCIGVNLLGEMISYGFNRNPYGSLCEDDCGNTLPEVVHAEDDMFRYVSSSRYIDSVFVTCEPCEQCAKILVMRRINFGELLFKEVRSSANRYKGVNMLKDVGIPVFRLFSSGRVRV